MKALITGAHGFVGRYLTEHLQSEGDVVVGVDRDEGPDLLDGAGWHVLLGRVQPDAVYHLAGQASLRGRQRAGGEPGCAGQRLLVHGEGI